MRVRNSCTERQLSRESKRRTRILNQISIWLRKATVPGSVHETNAMSGVGEKSCARTHAGEMATFAFDAQFLLDITLRSDQAHQRFGLMSVKLIGDKDPGLCWLLAASIVPNWPMSTPHTVSYFLPIPKRQSTIASID